MRPELVSKLPSIYRNAHDIKSKSSASIRVPPPPSKSQETSGKALGWGSWIPAGCQVECVTLGKSVLFREKGSWPPLSSQWGL